MARLSKTPLKTNQHIAGGSALIGLNGDIICYCNDLYRADIEKMISADGLARLEEITARTHSDAPCALCSKRIAAILQRAVTAGARSAQTYV